MSLQAASDLSLPSPVSSTPRHRPDQLPLTVAMVIGIAGMFLFLSSQILVFAGAIVWAIGATLGLGLAGFSVLGAAIGLPACWLCWRVFVMAVEAERDPANN